MLYFDYCCEVWDSLGSVLAERLLKLHSRCTRVIMHYKNEAGQSGLALQAVRHLGWSYSNLANADFILRLGKCLKFSSSP